MKTISLFLISQTLISNFLICFFLLETAKASESTQPTHHITLKLKSLKSDKGQIAVALFDQQNSKYFPDQPLKAIRQMVVPNKSQNGQMEIEIDNILEGTYAVSVFHDKNSNNKFDTGIFGIPREGIGFSNNPKLFFGPPNFSKCEFQVSKNSQSISSVEIEMKHF